MQLSKLILGVFTVSLIISCNNRDKKLESALEQAGENKGELLKVIERYKKNPADSLKLKAAHYLIKNMPGHFSYDTSYLYVYRPVIDKISLLRAKEDSNEDIKKQVNPLMDSLIRINPLSNVYSKAENDLTSIKSELLINSIEQAFEFYNHNPFKDSILFDDFLEYVLPYRVQNGYCLEDWRSYFARNYSLKTVQEFSSVHQFCDSLLYNFKDVKYVGTVANQFPYIKIGDYLKSLKASCPQKCWLNCLLLRSFGIPVTIDFVPACRIHETGHEWNSLKLKNGFYPFDPFWEGFSSIQYLKASYGRKKIHPVIGPIQFPKIYRKTFKMNISELLNHAINSGEEIPLFFQNPFITDVTAEYFKTFAIESTIIEKLKEVDYAYACVMGSNQTWMPVDFGKIKRGKISFNSLGSANVYLPSFYEFGNMKPAAYPILLNEEGKPLVLCPDTLNTRRIEISYVAFLRPEFEKYKKSFIGCTIEGSNNVNFNHSEVLYQMTNPYEPGTHHIPITSSSKFRFIRFTISHTATKLNEIKFLGLENGAEKEMKGKLIYSYPKDSILLQNIVDEKLLTGVDFENISREHKLMGNVWIGYDLKRPVSISAFEFYFVFNVNVRIGGIYELLYWDFGWKSLGIKKSESTNPISFDHVPKNALLMIKIHDTNNYSRPFTYSEEKQHWW